METYGFHFRYRLCGKPPTVREYVFKDSETITAGDLVNLEQSSSVSYADLAATNDSMIVGAAQETLSGTTAVTKIKVIVDWDAVYAVTDATARYKGEVLDFSGATGAQTVATDSNHDLVVAEDSTASEPTLVIIKWGEHPLF